MSRRKSFRQLSALSPRPGELITYPANHLNEGKLQLTLGATAANSTAISDRIAHVPSAQATDDSRRERHPNV